MGVITEKDVLEVIKSALNLKKDVNLNMSMKDLEEWDSLGHIAILSALDKTFDGKVASITAIAASDSVGAIVEILKANGLI